MNEHMIEALRKLSKEPTGILDRLDLDEAYEFGEMMSSSARLRDDLDRVLQGRPSSLPPDIEKKLQEFAERAQIDADSFRRILPTKEYYRNSAMHRACLMRVIELLDDLYGTDKRAENGIRQSFVGKIAPSRILGIYLPQRVEVYTGLPVPRERIPYNPFTSPQGKGNANLASLLGTR